MQSQIDAIHPEKGTLEAETYRSWRAMQDYSSATQINNMSAFLFIGLPQKFGPNVARAETHRRLARLACRLEEYRLARSQYPDELRQLPDLPPHLNQEVLSDAPLHYHRETDGFSLYSMGWDQVDDGGVSERAADQGDWAWRQR